VGIFILAGLAVLIALIFLLQPKKEKGEAMYNPGTYTAQIVLHNKPVLVEVTVTADEITAVGLTDLEESQEVFYPLFRPTMDELSKEVVLYQTANIPVGDEAPVTGKILLEAINNALLQAVVE